MTEGTRELLAQMDRDRAQAEAAFMRASSLTGLTTRELLKERIAEYVTALAVSNGVPIRYASLTRRFSLPASRIAGCALNEVISELIAESRVRTIQHGRGIVVIGTQYLNDLDEAWGVDVAGKAEAIGNIMGRLL